MRARALDFLIMSTAKELLKRLRERASKGVLELKDVEKILTEDVFASGEGLLCTTDSGNTLLHLAAQMKDESIFALVFQAYKRSKLFSKAMLLRNKSGKNPIHIAIKDCQYGNVILLYKECQDVCPQALEPNDDGWSLMHSAAESAGSLNIVKFLLTHDVCNSMLLAQWKSPKGKQLLPVDVAGNLTVQCQYYVKSSEQYVARAASGKNNAYRDNLTVSFVVPKKNQLAKANELFSYIQRLTVELKAEATKKQAKELEMQKVSERKDKMGSELMELLQEDSNWDTVLERYLLSEDEETQKITMSFLAERSGNAETPLSLPPLTEPVLKILVNFLDLPEDDPFLLDTLKLLREFTKYHENKKTALQLENPGVLSSKLAHLICSLNTDLQSLCLGVFLNLVTCKDKDPIALQLTDDSCELQSLLLVKHFSSSDDAKRLAVDVTTILSFGNKPPDPGSWSVGQVSFWMESNTGIEKRSEYRKSFLDAGIDGLHLLELSSVEMMGLGVKFVSDQRKLSNSIDELRRMNMRAIVGQKDVFLSYAHITINFARRIKKVLNDADYTVWIDEAGIRAGHKWRNEIADGIQGCRVLVFVMTPRSTNSEYCQDEIALAEEYHKPIMTLRLEHVTDMDPGLKLIIQRRQFIDFMEESMFHPGSQELVKALRSSVGPGSGINTSLSTKDRSETSIKDHTPDEPRKHLADEVSEQGAVEDDSPATEVVLSFLREEFEKMRQELRSNIVEITNHIHRLETTVSELSRKLDSLTIQNI